MTPTQLSALAALCGVTPESRPDLMMWNHSILDYPVLEHYLPDPTAADADPQVVDGVYLSGLMWAIPAKHNASVERCEVPHDPFEWSAQVMHQSNGGYKRTYEASATLTLLRAAQAAGVAEVVKIMEGE